MPELPEVEICGRSLRRWCLGQTILAAGARPGPPLRDLSVRRFREGLVGRRVESVDRIGKQLFLDLEGGLTLLVHLGMTGKFVRASADRGAAKSARAWIEPAKGVRILFLDPRRFGRLRLLPREQAMAHPEIEKLGPDALELLGSRGGLARALAGSRSPVKAALLDQSRLAGIGNIYACEGLFGAGIDPFAPSSELSSRDLDRLQRALLRSLKRTLSEEDGDEVRYLSQGRTDNPFLVYGRAGETCPRCGVQSIERRVLGGRGTYFCRRCQRTDRGVRAVPRSKRS